MKVAILAGGRGRRLGGPDEPPKPLARLAGRPVVAHVIDLFRAQGFDDVVVALGHRADEIRAWFATPEARDLRGVTLVDTGADTASGGRVLALRPHLGDAPFLLTWCDGLADVDLRALVEFHRAHGRLATVTAVAPPPRFGLLDLDGDRVTRFREKARPQGWINGAFFCLEPGALDYVDGPATAWERGPLERLAADGELIAFRHEGFWQCLDTPAEHAQLDLLAREGRPPWVRARGSIALPVRGAAASGEGQAAR